MNRTIELLLSLFLALGLLAPATNAATGTASRSPAASGFSVKFASGGATADGRARMKQMARGYDLLITMKHARNEDDYTDANIMVSEAGDKVDFSASAGRPLFYIQIPPGNYMVTADLNGKHLVKSVRIKPNDATHLTFDWRS